MEKKSTITISDDRKIYAIQKEFSKLFPYLSIEFFARPHTKYGSSSTKLMKNLSKTIGECRTSHKKGHIDISPSMIVNTLEQLFQDNYGITVQIFRKSGNTWLETTATDGWTLEKQNAEGEALSQTKFQKPTS